MATSPKKVAKPSTRERLSFLDAAVRVMSNAGEPLTTGEIVDRAIKSGLVETRGKTPEATLAAILYRSISEDVETPFERIYVNGPGKRAQRGSVRWQIRPLS